MDRESDDPALRVVVAGGGPGGLYTAWRLAESGHDVTVLEREPQVGGLAATMQRGHNFYSFGTHHLHSPDEEKIEPFRALVGSDLVALDRRLLIKFMGRFYPYPLKTGDMLRGLSLPVLVASTASLAKAMLAKRVRDVPATNAEEAVIQLYGRRLYDIMFRDYTTRFWGVPPAEISSTFVDKRMPGISAVENIKKFLAKLSLVSKSSLGKTVQIGSGKMYTTPRGVGKVYEAVADTIRDLGGAVWTSSEVERIECDGSSVRSVTCAGPEGPRSVPCDLLVSTMPVSHLVQRLTPAAPSAVIEASDKLGFRALLVVGFLVRPKKRLDALFTYFPDRTFHRLAELQPPSSAIQPDDCTILLAELTCDTTDDIWKDPSSLREPMIRDLVEEGLVEPDGVLETHYFKAPQAYPKYFLGFESALATVKDHVAGFDNLVTTGRQGNFQFTSMIPTMQMAWQDTRTALERLRASGRSKVVATD